MGMELDIYKNGTLVAYYTQSSVMMHMFSTVMGYTEEEQELTMANLAALKLNIIETLDTTTKKRKALDEVSCGLDREAFEDYMETLDSLQDEMVEIQGALNDINFISNMYIDSDDNLTFRIG